MASIFITRTRREGEFLFAAPSEITHLFRPRTGLYLFKLQRGRVSGGTQREFIARITASSQHRPFFLFAAHGVSGGWNREESRVFVFNHSRWSERRRERKSHKYINTKMSARSESAAAAAGGCASLFSPPYVCFRLLRFFSSEQIVPIDVFSKAEWRTLKRAGLIWQREIVSSPNGRIYFVLIFLNTRGNRDTVKRATLSCFLVMLGTGKPDQAENLKLIKESKERKRGEAGGRFRNGLHETEIKGNILFEGCIPARKRREQMSFRVSLLVGLTDHFSVDRKNSIVNYAKKSMRVIVRHIYRRISSIITHTHTHTHLRIIIRRDCGKETNYTNNVLLREKEGSKVANYSRHGLYEIFKLSFLHQRA